MADDGHVKAFRLFELCQAGISGRDFELADWEKEHIDACSECKTLMDLFRRQVTETPSAAAATNGEINTNDGYYRNVCCGLEVFVSAGQPFPDCQRHPNLPTI